jgi:dipeptidase
MCDTMAVVSPQGVLLAKNSDRDPNEAQLLDWQPRQTYPPGTRLQCTWIEIDQAPQTYATLLSRPFWMWGAEMGANEWGVTIGNEAVFTREPYAATGLTGMDLLRLALERSRTAHDAVQTIVTLLEAVGQGGGCGHENRHRRYHNSFLVADPTCAFVLETAGRRHAVEPVQGARSISNGLTIPGFAERYSDTIKTYVSGCRSRRQRTESLAGQHPSAAGLMSALRDHGDGQGIAPRYAWLNGGLNVPCVHGGGNVASSQTAASWVADLRPGALRHWVTGTAAPCTSLFKPVAVDQPLDLGPPPTDRADGPSGRSLWWRHERLHRAVMRDPTRLAPRYYAERDAREADWLADPPESQAAFAEADALLERWTQDVARQLVHDVRPGFVRRYWARRDRRAGIEP